MWVQKDIIKHSFNGICMLSWLAKDIFRICEGNDEKKVISKSY